MIMKNIFLLSTDKETNLIRILNDVERTNFTLKINVEVNDIFKEYVNIYITNTEKPLVDDWVFNTFNNTIYKIIGADSKRDILYKSDSILMCDVEVFPKQYFKVVITNDTSLIEDGVQEIPSVFLSFFAENPVDYVRVEKWLDDDAKKLYTINFPQKENKTNKFRATQEMVNYFKKEVETYKDKFISFDGANENFAEKEFKTEEKLYTKEEVLDLLQSFACEDFSEVINIENWFNTIKK